jgi:tetratricopeptide (TPR) repeat protein
LGIFGFGHLRVEGKVKFFDVKRPLAPHWLKELQAVEDSYSSGDVERLLKFGSPETGNWSQIRDMFRWLIENGAEDPLLLTLSCEYPAVAPNLLNALQSSDERLEWLDQALKNAHLLGNKEIIKVHLGNFALMCRTAGRLDKQLLYLEKLSQHYSQIDSADAAAVMCMLGEAYRLSGKYDEGIRELNQSEVVLKKYNHPLLTFAYHNLGITYRNRGEIEKSAQYHHLERNVSEREKDWVSYSRANLSLAILYQEELEIEKAFVFYEEAQIALDREEIKPSSQNSYIFRLNRETQQAEIAYGFSSENWQKFNKIPVLGNKGSLEYQVGRFVDALQSLDEAIHLCRELSQKRYEAIWYHKKGMAHWFLGEYTSALTCHQHSLDIAGTIKASRAMGFADWGLAKALIIQNFLAGKLEIPEKSLSYFSQAYTIAMNTKNVRDLQEWGADLAEAHFLAGDNEEAAKILEPLTSIIVRENRYKVLALYGIVLTCLGKKDAAGIFFDRAFQATQEVLAHKPEVLAALHINSRLHLYQTLFKSHDQRLSSIEIAKDAYKKAVDASPSAKGLIAYELANLRVLSSMLEDGNTMLGPIRQLLIDYSGNRV